MENTTRQPTNSRWVTYASMYYPYNSTLVSSNFNLLRFPLGSHQHILTISMSAYLELIGELSPLYILLTNSKTQISRGVRSTEDLHFNLSDSVER